jgi:hypothetical protein
MNESTTNDLVGLPMQGLVVARLLPVALCWCFVLFGLVAEDDHRWPPTKIGETVSQIETRFRKALGHRMPGVPIG